MALRPRRDGSRSRKIALVTGLCLVVLAIAIPLLITYNPPFIPTGATPPAAASSTTTSAPIGSSGPSTAASAPTGSSVVGPAIPEGALAPASGPVVAVATAQMDGRTVVISAGNDFGRKNGGEVRMWDLATHALVEKPLIENQNTINAMTTAQVNGRTVIIVGHDDKTIRVWDLATYTQVGRTITNSDRVRTLTAAPLNGRAVILAGLDGGIVQVWDPATGTPLGPAINVGFELMGAVTTAQLNGRPVVIVTGSEQQGDNAVIAMWDLATHVPIGQPIADPYGPASSVTTTQLDGRPVLVLSSDNRIYVCDLMTHALLGDPIALPNDVSDVAEAAVAVAQVDGRPVIVAGIAGLLPFVHDPAEQTVRLWDLATHTPIGVPFTGHTAGVPAVATTQLNGRPVAISGSNDGTVRVWDLEARSHS